MEDIRDWVIIGVDHERYCFDIDVKLYYGKTLREVCDDYWGLDIDRVKKLREDDDIYECDCCCTSELDTKYSYPDLDATKLQHIHIDYYLIFPLDQFLAEGSVYSAFGTTNNKFGLLDIKRGEK